jgi:hypothetical protein
VQQQVGGVLTNGKGGGAQVRVAAADLPHAGSNTRSNSVRSTSGYAAAAPTALVAHDAASPSTPSAHVHHHIMQTPRW